MSEQVGVQVGVNKGGYLKVDGHFNPVLTVMVFSL